MPFFAVFAEKHCPAALGDCRMEFSIKSERFLKVKCTLRAVLHTIRVMNSERAILHVDMDAFYASVEVKDNPSLLGKPVLVGASPEQRGVVAACSYEARQFGVHSAMPMGRAMNLCPGAIVLPVRMGRYVEISRQIHEIFRRYTPDVEALSIDEAFLDVSGCIGLFGSAEEIGRKIKADIKEQTGLTASVGVASNKFLAKLASDLEKPDGFAVIREQDKQQILDPLPASQIRGIGKVTAKALEKAHIRTIRELRTAPRYKLSMVFGNHVEEVLRLAEGIDSSPVEPLRQVKSISAEETFATDIEDPDALTAVLAHEVEEVAEKLRAEHLQCKTITLKLRYGDFKTITRSVTMDAPSNTTHVLLHEADRVLAKWQQQSGGPLRLLGFGVSGLSAAGSGQLLLFTEPEDEKQKHIDSALDKIREKYGPDILKRGS